MVTASLALPPGLHLPLLLPGFGFFFFGSLRNWNSRPVFNIRMIKSPPINPLLVIILKGLTIHQQYPTIDSHSSPSSPCQGEFLGASPPPHCSAAFPVA